MAKVLTKKAFTAWLKSKKPSAVVGIPGASCGCPIARFLKASTGKQSYVNTSEYEIGHEYAPLPKWAGEFIDKVDDKVDDAVTSVKITAQEALKVLRSS